MFYSNAIYVSGRAGFAALAALMLSGAAHAQVKPGTALNLAGFTPTLVIDASHPPNFISGEQGWWGPDQLLPQPFTLEDTALLGKGIPPNSAYAAVGLRAVNGSYKSPFWSGYANENEVYPNADTELDVISSSLPSISASSGVIEMIARTITPAESSSLPSRLAGRKYVSGAFNTYPRAQQYGYFETVAQFPAGAGYWGAFWLVPENMNLVCPAGTSCDTEIDVVELIGGTPGVLNSTLHTSDRKSSSYPSLTYAYSPKGTNWTLQFHRYGVDWEPNFITFYVDGVSYYSAPTPADMHQPMYIIENLAIGVAGTWAGAPTSSTPFPATMSVEAVRVWASPSTVPVP